jgi:hypothetical protein
MEAARWIDAGVEVFSVRDVIGSHVNIVSARADDKCGSVAQATGEQSSL